MKSATGYIFFDEKRKRWIAKFTPVDKDTGKQKEFKRYCLTKTEARKKLQELKNRKPDLRRAERSKTIFQHRLPGKQDYERDHTLSRQRSSDVY